MTSRILRPVERMAVQFSDNVNADIITLARRINVTAFKEVTAYFRMHSQSGAPTTLQFIINADGYTDEDPAALTANVPGFQVQLSSTNVAGLTGGQMAVVPVSGPAGSPATTNFGSLLSLQLSGKAVATTTLVISVDLICKEF